MTAIVSILFSNYYALFYNIYYLQYLFLENSINDHTQIKNNVYTFQLKSFERDTFSIFSQKKRKINKIRRGGEGSPKFFRNDFFGMKDQRVGLFTCISYYIHVFFIKKRDCFRHF